MASIGARLDLPGRLGPFCYRIYDQIYHRLGPLHPAAGEAWQYGQDTHSTQSKPVKEDCDFRPREDVTHK